MIGNALEQEIIAVFRHVRTAYSINQISKILKKAYPYINKKVNSFIREGIFEKIVVGRSYLCCLNIKNEKTIILMTINALGKRDEYVENSNLFSFLEKLYEVKNEISISTSIISNNKLIFVLESLDDARKINKIKKLAPRKFELVFCDKSSFQTQLISDKSILEDQIILLNFENYFSLVQEVVDKIPLQLNQK